MGIFLNNDEKGKLIPKIMIELVNNQNKENELFYYEVEKLQKSIDLIKNIISVQQSIAGLKKLEENINIIDIINDALHINISALNRHNIDVEIDIKDNIQTYSDRIKLLQVLINLLSNAKDALVNTQEKKILVTLQKENENNFLISIKDNGVGILEENKENLFQYGFTTKKDGHGFGLHTSALSIKDLGGEILMESDGPNFGSTFSVRLPIVDKESL